MEQLIHESFVTLQEQVNALASGTNPIVYFPEGTERFPELPANADVTIVEGKQVGAGVYFYNPKFVREKEIHDAVKDEKLWLLLSFVQSKEDAVKGKPMFVVARNSKGQEVKTAIVDASNPRAVTLQILVFKKQFPFSFVQVESVQRVLTERLQSTGVFVA